MGLARYRPTPGDLIALDRTTFTVRRQASGAGVNLAHLPDANNMSGAIRRWLHAFLQERLAGSRSSVTDD